MPSDFDSASADIPIWGWLSGANARVDRERNELDRSQAQRAWQDLMGGAPSAEDLTPTYGLEGTSDAYGDLLGGPSQLEGFGPSGDQTAALAALRSMYESGGYTDADRAAQNAARSAQAQQVGAMNRAALSQMEARGMGGSGAALASQLAGSQARANATQQSDASLQPAAMQRALQALQGYGALGTAVQGQELQRRNALDAFNQSNMDWRRGRETRNTAWGNRQQDADTQGRQQAYENRANATAGLTNQWSGNQSSRRQDAQRQDQADQAGAGAIAGIIEELL